MRHLILTLSKTLGLFALGRFLTRRRLRILCYHGVWLGDEPLFKPALYMRAATFERRLAILKRLRLPVLPLGDAVERLQSGALPPAAAAITIDDGWYGTYRHMLPALRRHGLPATIYVTTYYAVKRQPVLNLLAAFMLERRGQGGAEALIDRLEAMDGLDARFAELRRMAGEYGVNLSPALDGRWFDLMSEAEIQDAAAQGFDIELHTHRHDLKDFSPEVVRTEIADNRTELARILGRPAESFRHFCYPSGLLSGAVFPALRVLGVISATTTAFGLASRRDNPLALPRISDHEDMSDLEFEAQVSGFWSLLQGLKKAILFWRR